MVFSNQEMRQRIARAQNLMKNEKLDALFLSGEEDFQYFTDVSGTLCLHYSLARPAVVIVPDEGDLIAIAGSITESVVRSAVKDTRSYSTTMGVPLEIYIKALKDAGLTHRRVGIEEGIDMGIGQPVGELLSLMKAIPDVSFVDAAPLIWQLRMTKSKEELDLMRQAADITGRARQKTFDQLREGMTHREVARLFGRIMLEEGADRVAFVHLGAKEPTNYTQLHSDVPLTKGELIYIDGGAYVRTHTIDYPRWAFLGEPPNDLRIYHQLIVRISREMADCLRPGMTCSQLWKVGYEAIRHAGLELFEIGRLGHGQGLLPTEPPSVSRDDHTVLRPGMVVSTEPFTRLKDTAIIWEDVHVVTEDGHEQLTHETDRFRELS